MSVEYPGAAPRKWVNDAGSGKALTASVTRYVCPKGAAQIAASENRAAVRAPCGGYLTDFELHGSGGTDDDVWTLRVANGDTSVVLTMVGGGGADQNITDTTSKISCDEGDDICWKVVTLVNKGNWQHLEMSFTPR